MLRLLPSSTYQVSVLGVASGQQVNNVLHYRLLTDAPTSDVTTTDAAFLRAFRFRWRAAILPVLSSTYRVLSYRVQAFTNWVPGPGPFFTRVIPFYDSTEFAGDVAADIGQSGGDACPTYVAISAKKRTGALSRNYRGGLRLGPISEGSVIGNSLGPVAATMAQDNLNLLLDPIFPLPPDQPDTNPMALVVFSKTLFFALLVQPVETRDYGRTVTQLLLNEYLGSQISRKQRPGGA